MEGLTDPSETVLKWRIGYDGTTEVWEVPITPSQMSTTGAALAMANGLQSPSQNPSDIDYLAATGRKPE